MLLSRHRDDLPWSPRGCGSRDLTFDSRSQPLPLDGSPGTIDLDGEEMVATVSAGVKVAELQDAAGAEGLVLSGVIDGEKGTVGGLYSDPRESPIHPAVGRLRDHILGIEGIRGDGKSLRAGGRVVKNVTGYDLVRLLCGARGSLGLVTRLTLRLERRAQVWARVHWPLESEEATSRALEGIRRLPFEPWTTVIEPALKIAWTIVAGSTISVGERVEAILETVDDGEVEELDLTGVAQLVRRCGGEATDCLRVRLPLRQWPRFISKVQDQWRGIFPSAGYGILAPGPLSDFLEEGGESIESCGGSVVAESATAANALHLPISRPSPVDRLTRALRRQWDPAGNLYWQEKS